MENENIHQNFIIFMNFPKRKYQIWPINEVYGASNSFPNKHKHTAYVRTSGCGCLNGCLATFCLFWSQNSSLTGVCNLHLTAYTRRHRHNWIIHVRNKEGTYNVGLYICRNISKVLFHVKYSFEWVDVQFLDIWNSQSSIKCNNRDVSNTIVTIECFAL